jgi:hypothetical protein
MGLEITTLDASPKPTVIPNGNDFASYPAQFRLWKTLAGELVREGHPDAAFLYATVGDLIPAEEAAMFGMTESPAKLAREHQVEMKRSASDRVKAAKMRDRHQREREELYARQARERQVEHEENQTHASA